MRRLARIEASWDLFERALGLPDGARVVSVAHDPNRHSLCMLVASDDFDEVQEGCIPQLLSPTISTTEHECGHTTQAWDWRLSPERCDTSRL